MKLSIESFIPIFITMGGALAVAIMWFVIKAIRDSILKHVNETLTDHENRIKATEKVSQRNADDITYMMRNEIEKNS